MTTIEKPGRPPQTRLWFETKPLCKGDHPGWEKEWKQALKLHGGWDPEKQALTPMKGVKKLKAFSFDMWFVADSICAAYEEGMLTEETLVAKAFASKKELAAFAEFLATSADMEWLHERHHAAFFGLGVNDDYIFSYPEVSAYLQAHVLG